MCIFNIERAVLPTKSLLLVSHTVHDIVSMKDLLSGNAFPIYILKDR